MHHLEFLPTQASFPLTGFPETFAGVGEKGGDVRVNVKRMANNPSVFLCHAHYEWVTITAERFTAA